MINTSNKDDLEWGNKIPTPSPSNLTNGPILDHSALVAFGAPGSSERFFKNAQYPIFLVEYGNTNRMVVWLKV